MVWAFLTQLGKNLVGELIENRGEVADLLFALLGVFIYRKNRQDKPVSYTHLNKTSHPTFSEVIAESFPDNNSGAKPDVKSVV